jgi:hypothetical protein
MTVDGTDSWDRDAGGARFFEASASDKLVVVVSPEHNFGGNFTGDVLSKLDTEFPEWTGMGYQVAGSRLDIINAQLAVAEPAQHPEFAGTVFTADTRAFWREPAVSPIDQGYHWNHNGESHFLIGDAMGQGMEDLLTAP